MRKKEMADMASMRRYTVRLILEACTVETDAGDPNEVNFEDVEVMKQIKAYSTGVQGDAEFVMRRMELAAPSADDVQYVRDLGGNCPYCGGDQVMSDDSPTVDGSGATQEMSCVDCEKAWIDDYILVGRVRE